MNIVNNEPDSISKLALTPRRQTPEMAYLEWSDDHSAMLRPFYTIVAIGFAMGLITLLIHFG